MLDRVQISDDKPGFVRIEYTDHTGVVIDVLVIPQNEWQEMRNKVIANVPANFQISDAFTYLSALCFLLETC